MKTADIQNIALGVAALGLAYALYKTFSKTSTKAAASAASSTAQDGSLSWSDGLPTYTSYAPYDSTTLGGQLAIQRLLNGASGARF